MRKALLFTTILLAAIARPVLGDTVQFGIRAQTEFDIEDTENESDTITQAGPTIRFQGDGRRYTYDLRHDSSFEKYARDERRNDWEHRTNFRGTWVPTSRWSATFTNNFSRLSSLRSSEQDLSDVDSVVEAEFDFETEAITTNSFTAQLQGQHTPRFSTVSTLSHFYRDPENEGDGRQKIDSVTLVNSGSYQVFSDHRFGIGHRFRSLESSTESFERTTRTNEIFFTWNWQIDARTSFSLQAGPAFAEDDPQDLDFPQFGTLPQDSRSFANPDTCPPVFLRNELGQVERFAILTSSCRAVNQDRLTLAQRDRVQSSSAIFRFERADLESETNINPFFNLSLTRNFARGSVFASWSRTDSQTQSTGSETILDTVNAGVRYRISPRWSSSVTFRFSRRTTDSDREVPFALLSFQGDPNALGTGLLAAPIVGAVDFDQRLLSEADFYDLEFRTSREVGRYSSVFSSLRLRRTASHVESEFNNSGLTSTRESSENDFSILVGFNYRFRPIQL